MSTVRYALIGYGLFGTHHGRAIDAADHSALAAVAVHSEASRERAKQAHPDATVVADYRELIDRDDIDVVDVVVPNRMHFEVASAALAAGKHVFLEKPMALTEDDCDELVALAERRQVLLGVNHELRLSSLFGGARKLIDEGRIGEPQHVLIELSRFPYRSGSDGWRWDIERVGSWILEEPIHFFDLVRWYLTAAGKPASVYARANSRHREQPELRDNFSAVVNFDRGAYAVVSQTLSAFGHHQTAKIAGTKGTIWATWSAADARSERPSYQLRYGLADSVTEVTLDKPAGELLELADHVQAFTNAVRDGSPLPCTGNDGRWSTRLCLAADLSVDSGQVVSLD